MLFVNQIIRYIVLILTISTAFQANASQPNNFFISTIPKSGTYFITKYFYKLLENKVIPYKIWSTTHSYNMHDIYNNLTQKKPQKVIILIRDPRDIICSLVDWLEKKKNYENHSIQFKNAWFNLSTSQKICLLTNTSIPHKKLQKFFKYKCNNRTLPQAIKSAAKQVLPLLNEPHILIVRFEEMIGPKGGGTKDEQYNVFHTMNEHLNIKIQPDFFIEIVNSLWGRDNNYSRPEPTFNKGKIGRWKQEFNQEAITLMKEYYNDILIALNYEADETWDIN